MPDDNGSGVDGVDDLVDDTRSGMIKASPVSGTGLPAGDRSCSVGWTQFRCDELDVRLGIWVPQLDAAGKGEAGPSLVVASRCAGHPGMPPTNLCSTITSRPGYII